MHTLIGGQGVENHRTPLQALFCSNMYRSGLVVYGYGAFAQSVVTSA